MGKSEFNAASAGRSAHLNGHSAAAVVARSLPESSQYLVGHPGRTLADFDPPKRRWTINGDFTLDLTGAAIANGNSWTLVDTATKSFGATFTINGFTESADVHTKVVGNQTWSFSEATGVLTLAIAQGYSSWIGGFGLAWAAGFLVVFVPAGAGIREAVLVLTLSPILPSGPATLLALISRLVFTAGDLVWAGIGGLLRPRHAGNDNTSTTQAVRGTGSAAS